MIVVFPIYEFVKITEDEEIKVYEIPGRKMATIRHKGPYEECDPTYEKNVFLDCRKWKNDFRSCP
ncbi:GyrI-like domain-containing protein [Methanosarcina spelaei]|uniref:GyrI-like domain-containing protein n=1 Tax=Methanosarcina spelaei TaxID=1036679 RepID=UPI001FE457D1|nr:GyrI-like domain-containing protein [Methanosarcina spelaei]